MGGGQGYGPLVLAPVQEVHLTPSRGRSGLSWLDPTLIAFSDPFSAVEISPPLWLVSLDGVLPGVLGT